MEKFVLNKYNRNVPDEILIQDVKDVARKNGRETLTRDEYGRDGKYGVTTLKQRFRSWFIVLEKAGLQESCSKRNSPNEELFDDIKNVWISLERQPNYREFKKPLSKHSASTLSEKIWFMAKSLRGIR
jgi:hypothetical protein